METKTIKYTLRHSDDVYTYNGTLESFKYYAPDGQIVFMMDSKQKTRWEDKESHLYPIVKLPDVGYFRINEKDKLQFSYGLPTQWEDATTLDHLEIYQYNFLIRLLEGSYEFDSAHPYNKQQIELILNKLWK